MTYEVLFTPTARLEALTAAEYIAAHSPANAVRWYEGLEHAILCLDTFPERCPRAPESDFLHEELRHYIYKSHRIIFRIEEDAKIVRILHVHHSARRAIGESDSGDPNP